MAVIVFLPPVFSFSTLDKVTNSSLKRNDVWNGIWGHNCPTMMPSRPNYGNRDTCMCPDPWETAGSRILSCLVWDICGDILCSFSGSSFLFLVTLRIGLYALVLTEHIGFLILSIGSFCNTHPWRGDRCVFRVCCSREMAPQPAWCTVAWAHSAGPARHSSAQVARIFYIHKKRLNTDGKRKNKRHNRSPLTFHDLEGGEAKLSLLIAFDVII